jgi:hypothetical protein
VDREDFLLLFFFPILQIDLYVLCKNLLIVLNYLNLNGIKNNPHVPYSTIIGDWNTNYICDNILPNSTVCEIAGYNPNEHNDYWNKINEKMDMCKKHNIPFLLINSYKFINTKLDNFLDYIHDEMLQIFDDLKKPTFFEVIKSQHTVKYLDEIFNMFKINNHFTIPFIKEFLSK